MKCLSGLRSVSLATIMRPKPRQLSQLQEAGVQSLWSLLKHKTFIWHTILYGQNICYKKYWTLTHISLNAWKHDIWYMYDVDIGRKLQNVEINIFMALLHINMQSYAIKNGYICLLLAGSLILMTGSWLPCMETAHNNNSQHIFQGSKQKFHFSLAFSD